MASTSSLTLRRIVAVLLCVSLTSAYAPRTFGQDAEQDSQSLIRVPKLGTNPLAVLTLSSVERAREKFEILCDIAGCPETAADIISQIAETTDSLSGVNQSLPGGVAVYLDSIFPPAFEFVVFVPLTDTDAFMRTLELGPVIASPVAGTDGRYELLGPSQTTQVRVRNGYAFIQLPLMDPDEEFGRALFDPLTTVAGQTDQFDISVTFDVDSVPKATRNLILSFLTSTMSTQMQQRDEEADGLYEMRRAWMQADIDSFKLVLDECRQMSIGVSVETAKRLINVDFLIDVREGSDLLNEIFESTTKPSYFAPVLNDAAAVSVSMSQVMPDRDRERYIGVIDGLRKELIRQVNLKGLGADLDDTSPVLTALTALQETVDEGHVDVFGQCYADSEDHLVVVGALRVLEGETIAVGMNDMLNRLQGQDGLENLQIGVAEHAGIQFHRIGFGHTDVRLNAILGPDPGFVFGSGPRSMWFGLGGDETIDTLGSVIEQLQAAYEHPTELVRSSNMRIVVNIDQLLQLGKLAGDAAEKPSPETDEGTSPSAATESSASAGRSGGRRTRRRFRETREARQTSWREAFAEGGDRVRMDFQPTKTGARWRLEFGEAFLKGIGRAITVTRQSRNE
jgi:hypothetical protein